MRAWKFEAEAINGQKMRGNLGLSELKIARSAIKTDLNLSKEFKLAVRPLETLLIEYGIQMLLKNENIVAFQVESHERRGKYE